MTKAAWRAIVDRATLAFVALASLVCSSAMAEEKTRGNIDKPRPQGSSARAISPIFSQLVMLSLPAGFKTVAERTNADQYLREAVLDGETVDRWSQMITVTGVKGLAANPNVTARSFVGGIAAGFKRACPDTFAAGALGEMKVSGHDAFVALASCGTVQSGANRHSETTLLVAIQGAADYYSIQWAERGAASGSPMALDEAKWTERFEKLSPIKVCPRIAGEAAPYPSCINRK
jgi:hypothetical protein